MSNQIGNFYPKIRKKKLTKIKILGNILFLVIKNEFTFNDYTKALGYAHTHTHTF